VCVCSLAYTACNTHAAILPSVPCPTLPYFPTLSHKRHDFLGKVTEHKMCVLILCANLPETFLIIRRTERDMIKNVYRSACKVPVIVGRF
jgi:hypothetical protein